MLKWLQKKKKEKLERQIENYIQLKYREPIVIPSQSNTIKQENENTVGLSEDQIQFSKQLVITVTDDDTDSNIESADHYDSESIRRALSDAVPVKEAINTLQNCTNQSFARRLLHFIQIKSLQNSQVYKSAWIDRRLFSKIISDPDYQPSKNTCILLALGLKLTLEEANDLLIRAGYVLSHSSKRDIIIEYFFRERIYDLVEINECLYRFQQKLLQ